MADDKTLEVKITADSTGVKTGVETAAKTMQDAVSKINTSVTGMNSNVKVKMAETQNIFTDTFAKIKSAAEQFGAAILAYLSYESLKGSVEAAINYNESILNLSRTMGLTTEESSKLSAAIKIIGGNTDEYIRMNLKLGMTLKIHESQLNQIGIVTRDVSTNALLPQTEIFKNAYAAMMQYKEGTDRDQAALEIFGRRAQEVFKYQKMTNEVMEEATKIAEQYGLVIGDKAAAQTEQFTIKLNETKLIFEAIKIKIGQELLPLIQEFCGWMATNGKSLLDSFRLGVELLITAFDVLKVLVQENATIIISTITTMVDSIVGSTKIIWDVMTGQWKAAWTDAKATFNNVKTDIKTGMDQIAENAIKAYNDIKKTWSVSPIAQLPSGSPIKGGTKEYVAPLPKTAEKSRVSEWMNELDDQKAAENKFFDESTEEERAFWQKKLLLVNINMTEIREIKRKIYALDKKDAKDALEWEIANLRLQQEAEGVSIKQRIDIEDQIIAVVKSKYGEQSSQYRHLMEEREKMLTEESKFEIEMAQKQFEEKIKIAEGEIEQKQHDNDQLADLGQISAEKQIKISIDLENQRYKIEQDTLDEIAALWKQYPLKWEQIQTQIQKSTEAHNKTIQKEDDSLVKETQKKWQGLLSPITRAISQSVTGMIQGTQTLVGAIQNLLQSILASFVDMLAQMLEKWIVNQITMAIIGKTTQSAAAVASIGTSAAQGAAGAAASQASIPIIGPELAIAAAAEMDAFIMAFAAQATAARGFDVPSGVNPITQLHAEEMVLPASLANAVRGMASGQGRSGAGGTINIYAMDSQDVKRWAKRNANTLWDAAHGPSRNFRPSGVKL
jgi:hypothetical protein